MSSKWDEIISAIEEAKKIVILTHTNMDGDAMGSSSALCHVLRDMKKDCYILLEDTIPEYLGILLHDDIDFFTEKLPFTADLAIAVDCGDKTRIEKRIDAFTSAKVTACIDHHMQTEKFADFEVVEPDIAATGILIYQLIKEMKVPLNKDIAEDLYAAISTDTGSFKFRNTDANAHMVIADLYSYDIEADKLCNAIYSTYPLPVLKLEAKAIENVEVFANGKAAITVITQDMIKECNAKYEHADTVIDRVRSIEGVEVSCVLKETDDGKFKASLRAKDYADVNKVATSLGGGGHLRASGATLDMSKDDAVLALKKEIEKAL